MYTSQHNYKEKAKKKKQLARNERTNERVASRLLANFYWAFCTRTCMIIVIIKWHNYAPLNQRQASHMCSVRSQSVIFLFVFLFHLQLKQYAIRSEKKENSLNERLLWLYRNESTSIRLFTITTKVKWPNAISIDFLLRPHIAFGSL